MNQRGQVYPLFGFLLLSMMALSSLTIDMGYYRYQERLQQTATDSAALAGGQAAVFPSPNAQNAAFADASTNGFSSPNATVSIDPNYSDAYTASNAAVKVTITRSYPKWFSGFFGSGTQAVGTSAVAALAETGNGCITQLDPNGTLTLNGQKFNGAGCSILANGTMDCHGGDYTTISGITVNITDNAGLSCKNGPNVGYTNLINDPCPYITGCQAMAGITDPATLHLSCLPSSTCTNPTCTSTPATPPPGGTATAGCYSNMTFNSNVTFDCGPYTFLNNVGIGSGDLTSSNGATFYIGSGTVTLGQDFGSASSLFSAPSSGPYAGLLFYQPAANTSTLTVGANIYTQGMWYFPSAQYTENGHHTHEYIGDVVFASITYNGSNTTIIYPGTTGTGFAVKQAKLVE
jgi:hypothetical protein